MANMDDLGICSCFALFFIRKSNICPVSLYTDNLILVLYGDSVAAINSIFLSMLARLAI